MAWQITTRDGKVRTGTIVAEGFDSTVTVADAQGKTERIAKLDIEERTALAKSIMPDNLPALMTPAEFRDLVAFLQSRKERLAAGVACRVGRGGEWSWMMLQPSGVSSCGSGHPSRLLSKRHPGYEKPPRQP